MRESFVFYRSFYESIANCPDEAQLLLFRAVAQYGLDQVEPTFDGSLYQQFLIAIWAGMRPQLDANFKRFLNGCKGGGFGHMGGAKKGNQNARKKQPQNNPKTTPNVNDNDNDNVNSGSYQPSLNLPFNDSEFVNTWDELRQQPKWRGKTQRALQMCLNQLSGFDVRFAVKLMETAIANNYQGVVFDGTAKTYDEWQRRNQETPSEHRKIITNIEDLYRKENGNK